MNDDIIALAALFAAIAAIVPLALVHGSFKAQELHEAWRKLAYRHDLRFDPGPRLRQRSKVSGVLDGREFLLQRAGGNDKAPVFMELRLRHEPGADDSPARLRATEQLTDVGGEIDGDKLKVMVTWLAQDLEELDKTLHTLTAVAPVLEAA